MNIHNNIIHDKDTKYKCITKIKKNTLGVTLYFEATGIYELPLKIVPPMLLFSETISFDNPPSKDIVSLNSKRGTIFRGNIYIFTPKYFIPSLLSQKIVKYSISLQQLEILGY